PARRAGPARPGAGPRGSARSGDAAGSRSGAAASRRPRPGGGPGPRSGGAAGRPRSGGTGDDRSRPQRPAPGAAEDRWPDLPASITADQLDPEARAELRTLPGDLADAVARRLVAASLEEDPA